LEASSLFWLLLAADTHSTVPQRKNGTPKGHTAIEMTIRDTHLSPQHERQAAMRLVDGNQGK